MPDLLKKTLAELGPAVTRVGLGGEGVLRTQHREAEATAVIEAALAEGIGYFDCAPAYAGSQGYYGLVWGEHPDQRADIFQASKSAGRTSPEAKADLENTLATMNLDHLDLWQIHDLRTKDEFEVISGPGGALEAFVQAKDQGLIRFIGVTGHHDPRLLTKAVLEWPVDA
ncbi:MAG: aldo/keto reductase, partial [Proteobacteria bacterium]|nr:aldo/keto reductase [Pseudomonadota bacterium]MBU1740568.1 aldo/keto reductase [Pseudomonadota bacterium]